MKILEQYKAKLIRKGGRSGDTYIGSYNYKNDVVIKKGEKSLANEYKILTKLNHSFFPEPLNLIETKSFYYLILKRINGRSLKNIIRLDQNWDSKPLVFKTAVDFIIKIINHLKYIYDKGYLYRDLCFEHFIVNEKNDLYLLDFSECYKLDYNFELTNDYLCGYSQILSPEEFINNNKIGIKSTIYTIGLMLFQLIKGYSPLNIRRFLDIKDWNINKQLEIHLSNNFDFIKNEKFNSNLRFFFYKTINPNKNDRFSSLDQLISCLKSI